MKRDYSKETLEKIIKECFSISDVLRKYNLKTVGSNFSTIRKYIKLYNIDISHFTGQTWNKGLSGSEKTSLIPLNDILINNVKFKTTFLKKRLITSNIKENKCEKCGNDSNWCNETLTLELHHINGNHYDNRIENLQILCPNCHSQTKNFRNKNEKYDNNKEDNLLTFDTKIKDIKCEICERLFHPQKKSTKFCSRECYNASLKNETKNNDITKNQLIILVEKYNTISDIANEMKLSRPTIRKYLHEFGLFETLKNKYHFNAQEICQYDLAMNLIKLWGSIADAEETLKIKGISKCCRGLRKTSGGFIWKYKN